MCQVDKEPIHHYWGGVKELDQTRNLDPLVFCTLISMECSLLTNTLVMMTLMMVVIFAIYLWPGYLAILCA